MITKQVFKMIEDELRAYDKYKNYADAFRGRGYPKDLAVVFDRIAEMEMKHALWLKKVYDFLEGT